MKFLIGIPLLALTITNAHAAVIATNTFTGITDNTTTTATSAWTPGADTLGTTFGTTFTSNNVYRVTTGVDSGNNLSQTPVTPTNVTTSFTLMTGGAPIDLNSFSFSYYATTNLGGNQGASSPTATFSLAVTDGTNTYNGNPNPLALVDTLGATGNPGGQFAAGTFTFAGATLAANTSYTFTLTSSATGSFVTFDNFEVSAVPEPSVALLGGLGVLVLLRRRR